MCKRALVQQSYYDIFVRSFKSSSNAILVCGWTNPFEQYARQIGSSPRTSGWKFQKYVSCHHPESNGGLPGSSTFVHSGSLPSRDFSVAHVLWGWSLFPYDWRMVVTPSVFKPQLIVPWTQVVPSIFLKASSWGPQNSSQPTDPTCHISILNVKTSSTQRYEGFHVLCSKRMAWPKRSMRF